MPFCSFQAEEGFLAVVSAVRGSLCWAEAVSPLAKRRRGSVPNACFVARLSPHVLILTDEVQRGWCGTVALQPASTASLLCSSVLAVGDGRQMEMLC